MVASVGGTGMGRSGKELVPALAPRQGHAAPHRSIGRDGSVEKVCADVNKFTLLAEIFCPASLVRNSSCVGSAVFLLACLWERPCPV